MPLYGVTKYGSPRRWGYGGMPAAVNAQRAIIGGQAPWMGADWTIPWRNACAEVWSVDPETAALTTVLPALGVGSGRAATLVNDRYQEETLTVVLNDPTGYLPGGAYASRVALDAQLRVVWTVESPGGTFTYQSPIYSVQSTPSRDDDVLGGSPLTVTAIDLATRFRRQPASDSGYLAFLPGGTPPGFPVGWQGTFLADVMFNAGAIPLTPGGTASWQSVLDELWYWAPFRVLFAADGEPYQADGLARLDSGLVLSRDATVGGALAVPWERLTRTVRPAAFTRVEYTVVSDGVSTEGGGGDPDTVGTLQNRFIVQSTSSVNPHQSPPTPHTNRIFDSSRTTMVSGSAGANAIHLLRQELGQADTVQVDVDSAFPCPTLGVEVRLCDLPRVNGWYALVGVSQPFSEAPAVWTMEWREDVT